MSGAEAAVGLALAVLPLLVSTLENYDVTFRPFSRYRNFSREVSQFEKHMLSQKTIFKSECRLLLTAITDRGEVDQMLEQGQAHTSWYDDDMIAGLLEHLGPSGEACVSVIKLIKAKLDEIENETQGFTELELLGDKAWRKKVKEKLRFSFSKPKLQAYIEDLRGLNNDFINISGQTMRLESDGAKNTRRVQMKNANKALIAFQTVQRASQKLYEALTSSCTIHTDHSAHLCLVAETSFDPSSTEPRVRFEIAYTSCAIDICAPAGEMFWLSIESIISEVRGAQGQERVAPGRTIQGATNHLVQLTTSLKRHTESTSATAGDTAMPPPAPRKLVKEKSVTFEMCSPLKVPSRPQESAPSNLQLPIPYPCLGGNFCLTIQSCYSQAADGQKRCIGFLEHTEDTRHLVYQSLRHKRLPNKNSVTLATLLSRNPNATTSLNAFDSGLPNWERLRLARSLATAVLQFHETPWMQKSWRSRDVVFFGLPSPSNTANLYQTHESLSSPHLNVNLVPYQTSRSGGCNVYTLARNGYLFGLGVLLLELARQQPFASLQRSEDLRSADLENVDFLTARRESRTIGSELGPRYAKVVRQCLECDFGAGDDLTERELQDRVYRDVVCELEKLETAFRKIDLGD